MPFNHEIFLAHITKIFGPSNEIHQAPAADGRSPISVFLYKNMPAQGRITGITYGLSIYEYPEWKAARPEIIVSVESPDLAWPCAAATFVAEFRGKKRFAYGDVFTTTAPMAPDSNMEGFFIFAQSIMDPALQSLPMDDYTLHFSQFYPIYRSEIDIYNRIGVERFWKHPGFELYNIKRRPIMASFPSSDQPNHGR